MVRSAAFDIGVDVGTLARSGAGSITGILFIRVGGTAFPEEHWSDFPIVVLGWWLHAVRDLLIGGGVAACAFMDGPYEFRLRGDDGLWRLETGGPQKQAADDNALVDPREVVEALLRGSAVMAEECARRGWDSVDLDVLAAERGALAKAEVRH